MTKVFSLHNRRALWVAALLAWGLLSSGYAAVIVDDTWSDGTRNDTNLPAESAWYASNSSSLTATPGLLTGTTGGSSSRTWWTYFTSDPATPVQLAVGETLKVTLVFTCSGVNANNDGRALRLGVYD